MDQCNSWWVDSYNCYLLLTNFLVLVLKVVWVLVPGSFALVCILFSIFELKLTV